MGRKIQNVVNNRERAAAEGQVDAHFDLGLMYSTGHGVEQDYVTAHKWFNLAAAHGNAEALDHRAAIARDMTQADIHRAQRMAREWLHSQ